MKRPLLDKDDYVLVKDDYVYVHTLVESEGTPLCLSGVISQGLLGILGRKLL